eukprot:8160414-Pyramimonas_sp.AAC.1
MCDTCHENWRQTPKCPLPNNPHAPMRYRYVKISPLQHPSPSNALWGGFKRVGSTAYKQTDPHSPVAPHNYHAASRPRHQFHFSSLPTGATT